MGIKIGMEGFMRIDVEGSPRSTYYRIYFVAVSVLMLLIVHVFMTRGAYVSAPTHSCITIFIGESHTRNKQCCFSASVGHQVVVSILDAANSSYLAPFNVLSQRIKEGSVEANNNLKFLESITTPCQNVSSC